jgi:hypothetical protein
VTLDVTLLAALDADAEAAELNRSEMIERACETSIYALLCTTTPPEPSQR